MGECGSNGTEFIVDWAIHPFQPEYIADDRKYSRSIEKFTHIHHSNFPGAGFPDTI
jgi:hypothetical protein